MVLEKNSTFRYDGFDQLRELTTGDGKLVRYKYNGDGLRTRKEVDEQATDFTYDGQNVIFETDGIGAVRAKNYFGLNLVSRQTADDIYYYLFNGHGDVTHLLNEKGDTLKDYRYDPFGKDVQEPLQLTPGKTTISVWRNEVEKLDNPFRYAGQYHDEETGYYYLRARYYDPQIQRFISEDSFAKNPSWGYSLYGYGEYNPIRFKDPTGHNPYSYYGYEETTPNGDPLIAAFLEGASNEIGNIADSIVDVIENPQKAIEGVKNAAIETKNAIQSIANKTREEVTLGVVVKLSVDSNVFINQGPKEHFRKLGKNTVDTILAEGATKGFKTINSISRSLPKISGKATLSEIRRVAEFLKNNGLNASQRREVIEAFKPGAKVIKLQEDLVVYRYSGGAANPRGRWVTTKLLSDPVNQLALPPGNTGKNVTRWVIPKGTEVIQGTAARNFGRKGGAAQIYLPESNILK